MMWIFFLFAIIAPVIQGGVLPDVKSGVNGGVNGGADCATCSIVLGIVDHLTIVYNESAAHSLVRLCGFLPAKYKTFCTAAITFIGEYQMLVDEYEQ